MRHGRDTTGEQARRRIAEARLRTQLQAIAELARAHTLPAAAPRVLEALCRGLDWQMAALWRVDAQAAKPDAELLEMLGGIADLVGQFVRLREVEQRLRAGEARKSAILNAAFECIIGIDAQGGVIEFNPASVAAFGIGLDEVRLV